MALKHSVYDSDTHFSINPISRAIKNESTTKTGLIQHDHNSERFTFEMPKVIEGHDMSQCDIVEVHYINVDAKTQVESHGVYPVEDMQIDTTDSDIVVFSWLIPQNATKYVGNLDFLVRFACIDEDGNLLYVWNTAVHTGISVSNGIFNSNFILEDYSDVLLKWKNEMFGMRQVSLEQTASSAESEGKNVWTATFDDGTTKEFTVYNGKQGVQGSPGDNGKSAYEVAFDTGATTLSEEEWAKGLTPPEFYNDFERIKSVTFKIIGDSLTINTTS